MAKIVKTSSQETALKEIQEGLKIVTSLNELFKEDTLNDCKIKVMGSSNGKTVGEQFNIPYQQILMPLKDYRKKLVNDINQKSRTYSIVLDDADMAILDPKKEITETPSYGTED